MDSADHVDNHKIWKNCDYPQGLDNGQRPFPTPPTASTAVNALFVE